MCGPRRSRTSRLVFFPNVRGALAFAAESQDVVTAATVAIGVPELGVETSAEIDGQLFVVLSALTEGWKLRHCHVSRRGPWLRELAQAARKVESVHSGTSHEVSWGEILSPTQMKLPELMGVIEKMEDLVRCCCSPDEMLKEMHTILRKTFAWVPLKLCCQMISRNTCSWTVRDWLRMVSWEKKIKTYCEYRGHATRNVRQKGSSHPGRRWPNGHWCIWQRQGQTKGTRARDKNKDSGWMLELWKTWDTTRKTVGSRRTPKVVRRENTNPRMQMLTILTRNH